MWITDAQKSQEQYALARTPSKRTKEMLIICKVIECARRNPIVNTMVFIFRRGQYLCDCFIHYELPQTERPIFYRPQARNFGSCDQFRVHLGFMFVIWQINSKLMKRKYILYQLGVYCLQKERVVSFQWLPHSNYKRNVSKQIFPLGILNYVRMSKWKLSMTFVRVKPALRVYFTKWRNYW